MALPKFEFEKATQRYKYTTGDKKGQFVSQARTLELLEGYIDQNKREVSEVTQLLLDGKLRVSEWERVISLELKQLHLNAYSLGKGGTANLNQRDYGLVGSRLRAEYAYLRQFSEEILSGNLTKKQIVNRVNMYLDSVYLTNQLARKESHRQEGFRWERNKLGIADHCDECLSLSGRGWVAFGMLPLPGTRQCKMRCRCRITYSKELIRPENSFLKANYGWIGGLDLKAI